MWKPGKYLWAVGSTASFTVHMYVTCSTWLQLILLVRCENRESFNALSGEAANLQICCMITCISREEHDWHSIPHKRCENRAISTNLLTKTGDIYKYCLITRISGDKPRANLVTDQFCENRDSQSGLLVETVQKCDFFFNVGPWRGALRKRVTPTLGVIINGSSIHYHCYFTSHWLM